MKLSVITACRNNVATLATGLFGRATGSSIFHVGRDFHPHQLIAIHQGTGICLAAGQLDTLGDELHAHGLHLLLEVEIVEVCHAHGVERIAEVTQPFDVDAAAR